jgi:hypothetical protein
VAVVATVPRVARTHPRLKMLWQRSQQLAALRSRSPRMTNKRLVIGLQRSEPKVVDDDAEVLSQNLRW